MKTAKKYLDFRFGILSKIVLAELLFFSPCFLYQPLMAYVSELRFYPKLALANAVLALLYGLTSWIFFVLISSLAWVLLLAIANLPLKTWLLWGIDHFPELAEQYRINNWNWFWLLGKPYLIQLVTLVFATSFLVHLVFISIELLINQTRLKQKRKGGT